MEPESIRHKRLSLALWLIILMFTTLAEASPSRQTSYTLANDSLTGAMPDKVNHPIARKHAVMPIDVGNVHLTPAKSALSDGASANNEGSASAVDVPCLHGVAVTHNVSLERADNRCAKALDSQQRFGLRFGRSMHTRNYMLGEFDGLMIDYGLGDYALNGIAGFPAASGSGRINPKKQLIGFSAASGKLARAWDLGSYFMQLQGSDQVDRSALGGAVRYSQPNRSLLISADYDLVNHALSRFMVSGAWRFLPTTTLSTTLDLHQNYLPTPQSRYLQHTMALTEGWTWGLPFERIKTLSTDMATDVAALGLSLSHAFSQNIKLNSDMAILNVSKQAEATQPADTIYRFKEYYFKLKLSGKGLLLPGNRSAITLRHNVSDTSRLSSSLVDASYAINRQWQLKPRLQIDYRDNLTDNSIQLTASPIMKVEYRWHKQSRINFKAAGEWWKRQDSADKQSHASYVVSLGYRADF